MNPLTVDTPKKPSAPLAEYERQAMLARLRANCRSDRPSHLDGPAIGFSGPRTSRITAQACRCRFSLSPWSAREPPGTVPILRANAVKQKPAQSKMGPFPSLALFG